MRSLVFGAVAVLSAATLAGCAGSNPAPMRPAAATAAPTTKPAATTPPATTTTAKGAKPAATKAPVSDLSRLKRLGIDVQKSVLIDVADDGADRWLDVSASGVDFTGTARTDGTMMFLAPAPVAARNSVLIKPPFYNEDLGPGYCVADTRGAPLKLENCRAGRRQQIFTIVPAGDSGQFELHGMYGVIRVDNGKITTGGRGRTGLQTILYAD
ncbi:hypothetical protein [Actinoplanes xinjiangensis]|uniref:Ricin-type beta-trefoil lectin protein n=1 Tax=Actinoplanes xinjiangensis TaxID=512350 RepID=A0A316FEZ6_9ACTN|nr:hypothetical protein [Actinoplanes xinjiangensis]PWK46999.1 hypothetical protein BC793_108113 [Actinoplanes xinjiangensis]GIF40158.1 hypothetical protein Axi01nite_44690 [Actinoplanes xinjiangensis]